MRLRVLLLEQVAYLGKQKLLFRRRGCRRGCRLLACYVVHELHHQEHAEGEDGEVDTLLQEGSVAEVDGLVRRSGCGRVVREEVGSRGDGIAHAGLVTFDRKDRKDAYYLYRALWNRRSPTLHITEKRRNMRQDTIQQVKFYSSAAEAPVLTVNKDTIATRQIAPCQFISDSVVMKGRNEIVVRAGELSDRNSIVIVKALKQQQ